MKKEHTHCVGCGSKLIIIEREVPWYMRLFGAVAFHTDGTPNIADERTCPNWTWFTLGKHDSIISCDRA